MKIDFPAANLSQWMTACGRQMVLLPVYTILVLTLLGCGSDDRLSVTVYNQLDFPRREVVSIAVTALEDLAVGEKNGDIRIFAESAGEPVLQWIDYDGDGVSDSLLFMAEVPASESVTYQIESREVGLRSEPATRAFSRFVPERTDDYAWENDRVAFRTYGPRGQQEALEGVPGSTLSSGIDLWLKRTDSLVIDKWYANHLQSPGYYHIDQGEGYDPYHVGGSRGTGGIGVWSGDSLYVSRNFTDYRSIASGPLRTVFELDYAPWSPFGVSETKRISLDKGVNFYRADVRLTSASEVPNYAIGITLHANTGQTAVNSSEGWVRYWEKIDGAGLGEGLVMRPDLIDSASVRVSPVPDQSHLLILVEPEKQVVYYAGYAWERSGQIASVEDWDRMLEQQAMIVAHPLILDIQKQ